MKFGLAMGVTAAIALCTVCGRKTAAQTAFSSIIDVGINGGGASGLNDVEQVTGTVDSAANSYEAYRWSQSTIVTAGLRSEGIAINHNGVVVGDATVTLTGGQSVREAYYWASGSSPVVIGALSGDNHSVAESVNSSGQIAGWSESLDATTGISGPSRAFRWSPGSGLVSLPQLGSSMTGSGINSLGDVVGTSEQGAQSRGFLYTDSRGSQPIPSLGGTNASALAINDHEQVVGWSEAAAGTRRAFVWSVAGGITAIDSLGGSTAVAEGINNSGQVVGFASPVGDPTIPQRFGPPMPVTHAFYWDAQFGTIDLNPLGWQWSGAAAINASGQILLDGVDGAGQGHILIVTLPQQIPGDANHDGSVGFDDLLVLGQHYGLAGTYVQGDFDRNGTVNFNDLLILAQHYGQHVATNQGLGSTTVPEPASLAAFILLPLLHRRRRI